ncbi:MAG: LysM peptidoglycan-binding domain-containing protein [Panacagrimonas sp.]
MGNYSRSGWGIDTMLRASLLVWTAAIVGCAATVEAPPAPVPTSPPAAPILVPPSPPPLVESVAEQPVAVREDAPLTYVVKPGDTLWGIANRFLLDPWQWPEVWVANDQVRNPHRIYPGDVLTLSFIDGRPLVASSYSGRLERLSPQVRELPLEGSIPMIPIEAIRDFLRGPRLVTTDELGASPYLLAFAEEHIVGGSGMGIYVQNLVPDQQAYRYSVVRKGALYRDPDNGDLLGYEAVPVGEAEVQEYGRPSTAVLSKTSREALIGDRLLPAESEAFQENFFPHAPTRPVGGRIISVFDGFSQIGQYQIIALNRGTDHGLEPGHVLDVSRSGRRAPDPYGTYGSVALPELYAGQALVFKVTPRVSFALVMSAVRPIHLLDQVEKPGRARS